MPSVSCTGMCGNRVAVGDSSVGEGRLSVHAHTKHNIHRDYASVTVSNPKIVVPLN